MRGQLLDDELAQRVGVVHGDVQHEVLRAAEEEQLSHLGAVLEVAPELADRGAVCVRFTARRAGGRVIARVDGEGVFAAADSTVRDEKGRGVVRYGRGWEWNAPRRELAVDLAADASADLTVFTNPTDQPGPLPAYDAERQRCTEAWKQLLSRGATFDVPEPVVHRVAQQGGADRGSVHRDGHAIYCTSRRVGPSRGSPVRTGGPGSGRPPFVTGLPRRG